jgi:hypothetical protein
MTTSEEQQHMLNLTDVTRDVPLRAQVERGFAVELV